MSTASIEGLAIDADGTIWAGVHRTGPSPDCCSYTTGNGVIYHRARIERCEASMLVRSFSIETIACGLGLRARDFIESMMLG